MADKKISQLFGATTPLAGTEVLPLVQSGSAVTLISAGSTNSLGSAIPFAWANGDVCAIPISYPSA
jgi:hypothetical protein